jgi:hypothetical protein
MNHPNEDQLLAFALETDAGDDERKAIAAHLATCDQCRAGLDGIENDLRVIGGVRPQRHAAPITLPKRRPIFVFTMLKAAVLIIFGVVIGYSSARLTPHRPANISPSYMVLSPPADSMLGYAAIDATAFGERYYEEQLENRQ